MNNQNFLLLTISTKFATLMDPNDSLSLTNSIPEEGAEVGSAILFVLEELVQNMEILCLLKTTFSEKHQQPHQHLEEVPMGILHDQTPIPGPTKKFNELQLSN